MTGLGGRSGCHRAFGALAQHRRLRPIAGGAGHLKESATAGVSLISDLSAAIDPAPPVNAHARLDVQHSASRGGLDEDCYHQHEWSGYEQAHGGNGTPPSFCDITTYEICRVRATASLT